MTRRLPFWVGAVAWASIISHSFILIRSFAVLHSAKYQELLRHVALPIGLQETLLFVIPISIILPSIFMFEGHNWARLLFLLMSAVGVLYRTATFNDVPWPVYFLYLPAIFILFMPRSNRFFHQTRQPAWK